jgi:hypothetical protein
MAPRGMMNFVEPETRPDLVWDDEVRGLCVRVYGNGLKSFLFVYRDNDHQLLIRIGKTPVWSLAAARKRAKELRAVIDEGGDPASYHRKLDEVEPGEGVKVGPVENLIRYIAEQHARLS